MFIIDNLRTNFILFGEWLKYCSQELLYYSLEGNNNCGNEILLTGTKYYSWKDILLAEMKYYSGYRNITHRN